MPNVKIKTWRTRTAEDEWTERSIANGYFLMDGNWSYPDEGKDDFGNAWPVDEDGEQMDFEGRAHGKIIPGEVVEIDTGHPALQSHILEVTTEKAHRSIKGIPEGRKVRKRRGRPRKGVNPNNAEVRPDA